MDPDTRRGRPTGTPSTISTPPSNENDSQPSSGGRLWPVLDAAARGWRVFPLVVGTKRPAVKDWPNRATSDPDRITRYWDQHRDAGYGIACGPSGLLVVDLDDKDGRNGTGEWFKLLRRQYPDTCAPATLRVATPTGGVHWYFVGRGRNTSSHLAPGIDTRGDGGYVVGPGSRTVASEVERTVEGLYEIASDDEVALAPDWLTALLDQRTAGDQKVKCRRRSARTSAYGRRALDAEGGRVALGSDGDRNNTLYDAAYSIGRLVAGGEVDFDEATSTLEMAARRAGLGDKEAERSIRSGLTRGARRPRSAGKR